jgi:hypothetical protein
VSAATVAAGSIRSESRQVTRTAVQVVTDDAQLAGDLTAADLGGSRTVEAVVALASLPGRRRGRATHSAQWARATS